MRSLIVPCVVVALCHPFEWQRENTMELKGVDMGGGG